MYGCSSQSDIFKVLLMSKKSAKLKDFHTHKKISISLHLRSRSRTSFGHLCFKMTITINQLSK